MPDILIRNLSHKAVNGLKDNARRNRHSLQKEVKTVLEQAAAPESAQITQMFERWHKRFRGRKFSGSVALIRQARQR